MSQGDGMDPVGGDNGTPATQATLLGMPNKRRTAHEMEALRKEITAVLTDDHPQTCRSVFYRLVGRRAVPKTEAAYQGIVVRLLTRMRLDGDNREPQRERAA
jgi:hypothetical protein